MFSGTHSKEWRDTDDLLSSVALPWIELLLVICFSLRLVLSPFLVVLAGFCLLPFQ